MRSRWLYVATIAAVSLGCADREHLTLAEGELVAVPGDVSFDRVGVFSASERTIALRNVGRGPVVIGQLTVEGSDGTMYAANFDQQGPIKLGSNGEVDIKAKFAPTLEGQRLAAAFIRSDSRIDSTLRVPMEGVGVDARATVPDAPLDYGRIEAQSVLGKPLQLTNISDLPIQVTLQPVGTDQDEFATEATVNMAPNEVRSLMVQFAPQRVGNKSAHLQVTPCSGCAPVTVGLIAEALDRAVYAEPASIDFGGVPNDGTSNAPAVLHNVSTQPMVVTGISMSRPVDLSFQSGSTPFPVTLQPDQRQAFPLSFRAIHGGVGTGTAIFAVASKRNPTTEIALQGHTGDPELCITPNPYDYRLMPVGSRNAETVTLRNCGNPSGGPLIISSIAFLTDGSPNEDEFNLRLPTLPISLDVNQTISFKAFFEPVREGAAAGTLQLQTNGFFTKQVAVKFTGTAKAYPACQLTLSPPALDFGTIAPAGGAVLGVKATNIGSSICPVKNVHLSDDGGGAFGMPGGVIDGINLMAGQWFSFEVSFKAPPAGGAFAGRVDIPQAFQADATVPLTANSQNSCLVPSPRFLDFGVARVDCPVPALQTTVVNQCLIPVQLDSVAIGAGTTDGQFVLTQTPAPLPLTLNPGQETTIGVQYQASVQGLNLSPLFLWTSDLTLPYLIPLVGESSPLLQVNDRFVQTNATQLDVLFVVANSVSMVATTPTLIAAIPSFVSAVKARNLDIHIATTTSGLTPVSNACPGGALGGENGRWFPADNSSQRILRGTDANLTAELQTNVNVGDCTTGMPHLEAMRRALSPPLITSAKDPGTPLPNDGNAGFLRSQAALAVVFVGNDEDTSPDDVLTYVGFLQTLKGTQQPERATVYGIVPTQVTCGTQLQTATRIVQAAKLTGGDVLTDCAVDYSPLLQEVADKAFGPQTTFPLSKNPVPTSISVAVNGVAVATGWTYDTPSNSVIFTSAPTAGSAITISYTRACG